MNNTSHLLYRVKQENRHAVRKTHEKGNFTVIGQDGIRFLVRSVQWARLVGA
jgi:hypothetical protein